MTTAPKLWPGATVAILGTGPSLSQSDVDALRVRARVIAINDAIDLAPFSDVLYSSDQTWWKTRRGAPDFSGLKFSIAPRKHLPFAYRDVSVLDNTGSFGLETDPSGLRHGLNSGYAAINLAVHLGASRILLLGYNMGPVSRRLHFNGSLGNGASYDTFARSFDYLVAPLEQLGVTVLNCTEQSRLKCFPTATLRDALDRQAVAA